MLYVPLVCAAAIGKPLEQDGGHGMLGISMSLLWGRISNFIWCPCCFPSDASLTLPKVLAAVRTVDVRTLGIYVLEVPPTKRYEVMQQSASDEERREGLVKCYMDTHPNASWEHLWGRLLYKEEEAAMEEVKVHIKPTEGEYGVQCAILVAATGQFLSI